MDDKKPKTLKQLSPMYLKHVEQDLPQAPKYIPHVGDNLLMEDLKIVANVTPYGADGVHEVSVNVRFKLLREGQLVFQQAMTQAALYRVENGTGAPEERNMLREVGSRLVYAWLRVNFSDLVARAQVPPTFLPAIDWAKNWAENGTESGASGVAPSLGNVVPAQSQVLSAPAANA